MSGGMKDFFGPISLLFSYIAGKAARRLRPTKPFRNEIWIPTLAKTRETTNYTDSIPVLYTNDIQAASQWVDEHLPDRPTAVGWDMESSPTLPWRRETSYTGPATIQMSILDSAMVLQIADIYSGAREESLSFLSEIIEDETILKAGVGLDQDMLELYRWEPALAKPEIFSSMKGRLDMGGIGGERGTTVSLKKLADMVCGVELIKNKKLSISEWADAPLTNEQIAYAARDAWASAAVMHELQLRDPTTYSIERLLQQVLEEEIDIQELDARASARREAELEVQDIMGVGTKEGKRSRRSLHRIELARVKALEQRMKELAPPKPFLFDLNPLGLT